QGGLGYGAQCGNPVLVVPLHGGHRILLHRLLRLCLLALGQAPVRALPVVPAARYPGNAATVDFQRARLDRGRKWPAALDDRRRAADVPVGLQRLRRERPLQSLRLHPVLQPAGRSRVLPDDQIHPTWARSSASRASEPCNTRCPAMNLLDYETLRVIWWVLLGVLLIGFALTDGFDLGSGILLPFVARTDGQSRIVINAIGPVWEGNQVWLILGAGAIFAAWPLVYATAFSGFYLAMILALSALILRPVAIVYRSKT